MIKGSSDFASIERPPKIQHTQINFALEKALPDKSPK